MKLKSAFAIFSIAFIAASVSLTAAPSLAGETLLSSYPWEGTTVEHSKNYDSENNGSYERKEILEVSENGCHLVKTNYEENSAQQVTANTRSEQPEKMKTCGSLLLASQLLKAFGQCKAQTVEKEHYDLTLLQDCRCLQETHTVSGLFSLLRKVAKGSSTYKAAHVSECLVFFPGAAGETLISEANKLASELLAKKSK